MVVRTTQGFQVQVHAHYVAEQSRPQDHLYFFAYTVQITNLGDRPARLMSRHWFIMDGQGLVEEVRGPGIVGETPYLEPGESFEYTSYCPLKTPTGRMSGTYQMKDAENRVFGIQVPTFELRGPSARRPWKPGEPKEPGAQADLPPSN